MKKIFITLTAITILAALAVPGFAQGGNCRTSGSAYASRQDSQTYYDNSQANYDYSTQYRGRGFWDRHRDKVTVAAGTAGGAAIGGLIGGKKGAVIGALGGLGGSALYTYKLRNRRYR